jgi:ferric-dicitrate binding protein FerR (iron transport regulator)
MSSKSPSQKDILEVSNINPGGNYALLTLSDGKSISLKDAKNGLIDSLGKSEVLKTADGHLSYENSATTDEYHILSTPDGGQYSVLLQDGSRVWLNASSSLRYPVTFSEAERVVELKGEGYFEVAPSRSYSGNKKPFIVKVNGVKVNVLGTHFNVNAYSDEPELTTTLFEGKVSISNRENSATGTVEMKPGEQAKLGKDDKWSMIQGVDKEEVLAWKNGQFKFNEALIEPIMRQVSRWYNAEIIYEGKVNYHFNATIYRHEPVSKLLSLLEETNRVHFIIKGKKIIVKP